MTMKFCQTVRWFGILLFSFIASSKGDVCYNSSVVQNDVFMKSYTYRHIDAAAVYECASECMTSPVCASFNFDTESRTCHLNSNSSELVDVDHRPGFLFSDITHWNKSVVGSCSTMPCSANSRCKTTRNHKMQCVQEFHGCGSPPEIPDADVTYSGHFLHDEANYVCRSNFRSCDSPTGSVCQDTGEWSDPKLHCDRFIWHNMTTPIGVRLPCEEEPIGVIKLKATPTQDTWWKVNLLLKGDILLHVSCRFLGIGDIKQVELNTKINGRWQRGIRPTEPFPFTVNKTFYMEIRLKDGIYKMSIDGTASLQFRERVPCAIPDSLEIEHDVTVESLEAVV